MNIKLSDSELAIMQIIWRTGQLKAVNIVDIAKKEIGWEKNTSYTFLNRLIKKGAITREDPGFLCKAVCNKDELRKLEAQGVVNKLFDGSIGLFVQSFLSDKTISSTEKKELQNLINDYNKNKHHK